MQVQSLRRQLEHHVHDGRRIYRRAIALGWLELNLVGRTDCGFIESVSRLRNTVAHPATCNCAFDSFGPASAVAGTSAFGEIKRSQLGSGQFGVGLAFSR